MIKAIIFDCFGVLTLESWLAFRDEHFLHDDEKLAQAKLINKDFDSGKISFEQFIKLIAELAEKDEKETYERIDHTPKNEALLTYIKTNLHGEYKIGMLSNVGANWLETMFSREDLALFDAFALSFEIGYSKPDRRAYESILNMLHVTADEAVFIDDQARYVAAGIEAGITSLQFVSTEQAISELENLLAKHA